MTSAADKPPRIPLVEPRTERLLLRQWRDEDWAPFAALNADPEVMRHFPSLWTEQESNAFIVKRSGELEVYGYGIWAVEVVASGELIGFVGLNRPPWEADFTPCTEVGWRLVPSAWGHGYATEGARAALDVAFGPVGLEEVVSFTTVANTRSQAVMQRLGMTHTGDFDHPNLSEGHLMRPHLLYRLSAADWLARGS